MTPGNILLILFIVLLIVVSIMLILYYTGTLANTYPNFIKKYELEKINTVLTSLKTTTDKASVDRQCTSIKDATVRLRDKIKSSDKIFVISKGRVQPLQAAEMYMGDNARSAACSYMIDAPPASSNVGSSNVGSTNATSNVGSSNVGSTNATSNVGSSNVGGLTTTTSTYIIQDDERFATF